MNATQKRWLERRKKGKVYSLPLGATLPRKYGRVTIYVDENENGAVGQMELRLDERVTPDTEHVQHLASGVGASAGPEPCDYGQDTPKPGWTG